MQDINFKNKRIGIWGFGIVGKSAVQFIARQFSAVNLSDIFVTDKKKLTTSEKTFLSQNNATYIQQTAGNIIHFWHKNDFILVSPGIDLANYQQYKHKLITELDLFCAYFKKPIIAITGTVGKTSITHLLTKTLQNNDIKTVSAGNIGNGMLDLIAQQKKIDMAVIEVSSFQLEHCKTFAPDLAIWTNFFPNHLDRHKTIEQYFDAKKKIITQQTKTQKALLPLILHKTISLKENMRFFSEEKPSNKILKNLSQNIIYWIENDNIIKYEHATKKILTKISTLPSLSFPLNWIIIIAALDTFDIVYKNIAIKKDDEIFEHRIEHVATINDVAFYNDSKSTIAQSTIAAIQKFNNKQIILFLGGISKGVNRQPLIDQLPQNIKMVLCFGKEAQSLAKMCTEKNITSKDFTTLENAFNYCSTIVQPHDVVLFSPAGASFDLFKNYKNRGKQFKKLVKTLIN